MLPVFFSNKKVSLLDCCCWLLGLNNVLPSTERDLLSRLLFILMASSFGLARLLRGSGSQYFNSSVATFKEMAVLLLTQDRATSATSRVFATSSDMDIPADQHFQLSWRQPKWKQLMQTLAVQPLAENHQRTGCWLLLFFFSFCAFEDNYKVTWPWSLRTALQIKPFAELFRMGSGITVPLYRSIFFPFFIVNIHAASQLTPPAPVLPQHGQHKVNLQ